MQIIDKFDRLEKAGLSCLEAADLGVNATLYIAYLDSRLYGANILNFYQTIFEDDVAVIANFLEKEGINEFTISSNTCSLLSRLAAFEKLGFVVVGMTTTIQKNSDWKTRKITTSRIPAIHLKRKIPIVKEG